MIEHIDTINDIDFLLALGAGTTEVINLSNVERIKPVGVVALLAMFERASSHRPNGYNLSIRLPRGLEVQKYLRSTNVFNEMRLFGSFQGAQPEEVLPEYIPERPMVPCARFSDESDIDSLVAQMDERFGTEFIGYGGLAVTVGNIFSELAANVVHHADSNGGYVLAQERECPGGSLVEIAVPDCGIGIRASLHKNPQYYAIDSDIKAIVSALKEGVSGIQDVHRGYGLYHVTDDVRENASREMGIRSGTGALTLRGDGEIIEQDDKPGVDGTIVSVTIPRGSP